MTDRYASSVDSLWDDLERYRTWHVAWIWSAHAYHDDELADALAEIHLTDDDLDGIARFEKTFGHDLVAVCEYLRSHLPRPVRNRLHVGLTSSDIVDTGLAITIRRTFERLDTQTKILLAQTARKAIAHRNTPVVARTHGREASPTCLGRRWALLAAQVDRALDGLYRPTYWAAVGHFSGPSGDRPVWPADEYLQFQIERDYYPSQITCRDRHAAWAQALARLATACEQIAVEIRLGAQSGIDLYAEPTTPDQRGSSAMPHKRNPITSERICGLARVVRSHAAAMSESVVTWFERDISHSSVERIALRGAATLTSYLVSTTGTLVYQLQIDGVLAGVEAVGFGVGSDIALSRLVHSGGLTYKQAYESVRDLGAKTALTRVGLDVTQPRYDPDTEGVLWRNVQSWADPQPQPEALK